MLVYLAVEVHELPGEVTSPYCSCQLSYPTRTSSAYQRNPGAPCLESPLLVKARSNLPWPDEAARKLDVPDRRAYVSAEVRSAIVSTVRNESRRALYNPNLSGLEVDISGPSNITRHENHACIGGKPCTSISVTMNDDPTIHVLLPSNIARDPLWLRLRLRHEGLPLQSAKISKFQRQTKFALTPRVFLGKSAVAQHHYTCPSGMIRLPGSRQLIWSACINRGQMHSRKTQVDHLARRLGWDTLNHTTDLVTGL